MFDVESAPGTINQPLSAKVAAEDEELQQVVDIPFTVRPEVPGSDLLRAIGVKSIESLFWDADGNVQPQMFDVKLRRKIHNVLLRCRTTSAEECSVIGDLSGVKIEPLPEGKLRITGKLSGAATGADMAVLWGAMRDGGCWIKLQERQMSLDAAA